MVAAMMTAANLGARVTGWGFVVFTVGSIAWSTVGLTSGQTNLLASNGFLTLVNLVGIWRWLGRQAAYEDGARSAQIASRRTTAPTLFTATGVAGMKVTDERGEELGHAVEALVECATGSVSYIVVATGGVAGLDERLRAVPRTQVEFACEAMRLRMAQHAFEALPVLEAGQWPASAEEAGRAVNAAAS
ncbi:PRC-barrel domain-containing protein [Novosphingobium soli]|uniref:PRC-barrel domain-containing protein n=1 Tax=Novosphingobium soli TaxID=574956 RepID=A0ABV6CZ94_9SPHN